MAQFDVHRNLGAHAQAIPFVLIVQTRRLDAYRRRVVVPLVRASAIPVVEPTLNPRFVVEGVEVVLHPLDIVSVEVGRLGERVGSLATEADRVIAAIDAVITGAWG